MDAGKKKYDKPPHPRATCNVLSALTFSWTLGLFREGRKRDLEVTDLYEPLKEHTSSYLGNKLERYWNDELVQAQKRGRDPSFLRALIRCFGLKMASYGLVLAFMECVLRICQPFLLGRVIDYFSPPAGVSPLLNASTPLLNLTGVNRTSLTGLSIPPLNATLSLVAGAVTEMSPHEMLPNPDAFLSSAHHHSTLEEASLYAMGVIMSILASNVLMHCFMMAMFHLGMKIRVGTCSLIYRKVCVFLLLLS
uniref:Probable multidrug resistance-associated protein lethal(2)03659 n=1 Tax=Cacopsylla melanoneura TaxID=428564 RepID=A0A8D9A7L2_9HEMI